jgi:head-tail adaptor
MRPPFLLNRRLVLEEVTRQPDNAGGYTETWAELGVVWADMRAGTGRERDMSGMPVSRVPYRVVVRAAPVGAPSRPMPGQRMRDGDRIFLVEAVAEIASDRFYLECFASEEVLS